MNAKDIVRMIKEHVWGPVGSVIFHVILIIVLIRFATVSSVEKAPDVTVTMMEANEAKLDEINKEIDKLTKLEEPEVVDAVTPPDVDINQPIDMNEIDQATAGSGGGVGGGVGSGVGEGTFDGFAVAGDVTGPLVMKGLYAGRSAGGRAAALGKYGGRLGEFSERAVVKALEWLKNQQKPEGWWEPSSDKAAMTGLALLTFLAHGETTSSERYGATVEKAIRFLVSQQRENGAFTELNQHGVYEHAIATYAVCEAYGLTRIPSLKPVMEKAVDVILKGQQPGGGWDYFYKKEARVDLSVAGWQIQALKSAYMAGSENHNIKPALDKAIESVKTFQNPEHGLFGYTDNKVGDKMRPSLTGVAVLCMQLTGHGQDKEALKGLEALKVADCDWKKPTDWPMYAWYYITQAKFQRGGSEWDGWNERFAREFMKNQNEDGSWFTPAQKGQPESGMNPVYSTTLAALTLQVYYRFLPTYKPIEVPAEEKKTDDVSIEII